MKFSQFEYNRPNIDDFKNQILMLLEDFRVSNNYNDQKVIIEEINKIRTEFKSMSVIAKIKYDIDTNNKFFNDEQAYFDEVMPVYDELVAKYYKEIIESKYRKELENYFGKQLFDIAKLKINSMSQDIIEDLVYENKLCSQYTKLLASARIKFNGEEQNLSQMYPFKISDDREVRKQANIATYKFFQDNENEFDKLFDNLVTVRTKIARKLGFETFTEMGYARMQRIGYDEKMVSNFRKQILKFIVPVCNKLRNKQTERLKLDNLKFHDEGINFISGNAKIKGKPEQIIENGLKMYEQLSNETSEFFDYLVKNDLMDLETKKGKSNAGYCDYIGKYKVPFIFGNFNGTAADIDVLTHEAGHAFQFYTSRNFEVPEYIFPTLEACEVHSIGMEFITWPYMELFFKEDANKYRFSHMFEAVTFLPYGALVDEYQHYIYNNPQMSIDERKSMWRDLEKKYLPHREYEDIDFLEKGTYWYQQGHIFKNPFYYIDYALAYIIAIHIWTKCETNREEAWNDYLNLCKKGGSVSFLNLIKQANIPSPFELGMIESTIEKVEQWFNSIKNI